MKIIFSLLVFCLFIAPNALISQEKATSNASETVLTVGDEAVTLSDFEHIFMKNNRDSVVTIASLDEYLELFIRFKLKVQAAEGLGMDTVATFQRELAGYRSQLARPYMTNNELLQDLVVQAWERKQEEVHARHILVSCGSEASASDTLKAWKRANALRTKITNGEDFDAVARSKGGSDDPSVKDNGGDLGWFSAFQMLYPFEEAAFTTDVGNISNLVRTRYGYHVIEVTGRREARGEIRAAHIMIRLKKGSEADASTKSEAKIGQIYDLLQKGTPWDELALKMSEDGSSSSKGGELPWFGTGKMIESFEDAAFGLTEDGQISEPIQTSYGWHIIKRLEYRAPASFEASKREIEKKVSRDSRSELTRASFIENLKIEYNFGIQTSVLKGLYRAVSRQDSVFYPNHPVTGVASSDLSRTLLKIGNESATVGGFIDHLNTSKIRNASIGGKAVVNEQLKRWSENMLLDYEDVRLEDKHDAFRLLMEEYHDGILLFELTDEKVWSRAVKDSTGLEAFHAATSSDFMWAERADIRAFILADAALAKKVRKAIQKNKPLLPIAEEANAVNSLAYRLEEGLFSAGQNPWADRVLADHNAGTLAPASKGVTFVEYTAGGDEVILVQVEEIRESEPKTLAEARGQVIAAYQDQLEADWIEALRSDKVVEVNRSLLHSLAD
ncbi:MAG: peptidylprolyl isomerase [Flavobacteriales bacterium]|nr:peptidylprolyl isomerase [Flavobacteriales bacterium]